MALGAAPSSALPLPVVVLGIPVHPVTMDQALDWIAARIAAGGPPALVATVNLDFLRLAHLDAELHRILFHADLVLADGFPVVWWAKHVGDPLPGRVAGSDLTPLLAARAARDGFSLFLLGGAAGVAEQAAQALTARHEGLRVAGILAPDAAALAAPAAIISAVRAAKPGAVLVALGAPKQERLIVRCQASWAAPVAIGVGASLDFVVGVQVRAPLAWQRCYLEWAWRLLRSPRRLGWRYVLDLGFLSGRLLRQWRPASTAPGRAAVGLPLPRFVDRAAAELWIDSSAHQALPPVVVPSDGLAFDGVQLAALAGLRRRVSAVSLAGLSARQCAQLQHGRWERFFSWTKG